MVAARAVVASVFLALLAGCAAKEPAAPEAAAPVLAPEGAQTLAAGLLGVVVDAAVRPVPNATVLLEGKDVARTTSSDGSFSFLDLAPGAYIVSVQADPYLAQQVGVELASGAISQVRVVLALDESKLPYNVTFKAEGFADASTVFLVGGQAYSIASDQGVELCDCLFEFNPEAGAQALVLEAVMADCETPVPACVQTGFAYELRTETQEIGRDTTAPNPLRLVYLGLDPNATAYRLQLYPESDPLPEPNKRFEVFATFFYRADPAEGWSFVAQSPA